MTLQYEQKAINFQPEMGVKSYLFDQSATSQTDVVFNNWDSLLSVLENITGKKEILFAAASTVIPSGTYDMTDITFVGTDPTNSVLLDDVVLTNFDGARNVSLLIGAVANTAPVFSFTDGATYNMQFDYVNIAVGPAALFPMFQIDGGSTLLVRNNFVRYGSLGGVGVFDVAAGSILTLIPVGAQGGVDYGGGPGSNPFITGGGTANIATATGDRLFTTNLVAPPLNLVVSRTDDYEAIIPGPWAPPEPTNVKDALDRIAAFLVGPIP